MVQLKSWFPHKSWSAGALCLRYPCGTFPWGLAFPITCDDGDFSPSTPFFQLLLQTKPLVPFDPGVTQPWPRRHAWVTQSQTQSAEGRKSPINTNRNGIPVALTCMCFPTTKYPLPKYLLFPSYPVSVSISRAN